MELATELCIYILQSIINSRYIYILVYIYAYGPYPRRAGWDVCRGYGGKYIGSVVYILVYDREGIYSIVPIFPKGRKEEK